jgi:hypothetical protein
MCWQGWIAHCTANHIDIAGEVTLEEIAPAVGARMPYEVDSEVDRFGLTERPMTIAEFRVVATVCSL